MGGKTTDITSIGTHASQPWEGKATQCELTMEGWFPPKSVFPAYATDDYVVV